MAIVQGKEGSLLRRNCSEYKGVAHVPLSTVTYLSNLENHHQ